MDTLGSRAARVELVLHDVGLHYTFNSMTSVVTAIRHPGEVSPSKIDLALIALGLLVMYVPTYMKLSETVWSQEGQGHGPVMLALVLWLAWQRRDRLHKLPAASSPLLGAASFLAGLFLYVFGRSQDFPEFESGSQIFVLSALLLFYRGVAGVRAMWFPLFFIIFLIPLPNFIVYGVTAPLKAAVSAVADSVLYALGYPIGRTGVMLTIGQYRLLVADACAGMNSIFALEAVGVFYASIMNYTSKLRTGLLALFILPISFVSNVIRVIALALITYYFGDEVGQGFVHEFAGVLLFVVATILTIAVDAVIGLLLPKEPQAAPQGAVQS
jgi:exosortase B